MSSGQSVGINNLVRIALVLVEKNGLMFHKPAREGEALRLVVDVSKARREIGFEPRYSMEKDLGRP